ncbi:hypothetical protein CY652_10535 [Burkholderia sp. WAC0059]|uniref:glycine zipper 2TM domain-containing protein n=1 Tax=Burkholderia sp. WAC0059 TaxID=2066022 RepID=UPI000C7F36C7|nr:glycine zipper 2TM domain-containing protein [Burkholderia sp. WAC0059]PLZ02541.1 hypothetical protein CY652_10535 [Burkholderia sp. WAC0059]
MKTFRQAGAVLSIAAIAFATTSLSGCAHMNRRERDTAIGAGVGGVAGAVIGGGALATLGGAAVGGLIGNQAGRR